MPIAFPLFQVLPFWLGRAVTSPREGSSDHDRAAEDSIEPDHEEELDTLFVNVWAVAPRDWEGRV